MLWFKQWLRESDSEELCDDLLEINWTRFHRWMSQEYCEFPYYALRYDVIDYSHNGWVPKSDEVSPLHEEKISRVEDLESN